MLYDQFGRKNEDHDVEILDKRGYKIGEERDAKLYDTHGNQIGKENKVKFFDKNGKLIGKTLSPRIYDQFGVNPDTEKNVTIYKRNGLIERDVSDIAEDVAKREYVYKLVPKVENLLAELSIDYRNITLVSRGRRYNLLMIDKEEILMEDSVPERFRDILAAHEEAHKDNLTHLDIWPIELMVADRLSKERDDPTLKEDYIRWSSSEKLFEAMRFVNGHELLLNKYYLIEYKGEIIAKERGADGIIILDEEAKKFDLLWPNSMELLPYQKP